MVNPLNNTSNEAMLQGMTQRAGNRDEGVLGMQDFLRLLVAQMQNQDIMNPMDNTEFVSQMATFSTLTAINNMAEQTTTAYAVSLLGKDIVAAEINRNTGLLERFEGTVTGVSLFAMDGPRVFIGDRDFSLQSVMNVGRLPGDVSGGEASISTGEIPRGIVGQEFEFQLEASGIPSGAEVVWSVEAGRLPEGLTLSETGLISGIPLNEASTSFTVRLTDGDELTVRRFFGMNIAAPEVKENGNGEPDEDEDQKVEPTPEENPDGETGG
jgi:flagellar basal-body rod modification protein FlgD